jgi:hypothetical protein
MKRIARLLAASLALTGCSEPHESSVLEPGVVGTLDVSSVNGTRQFTAATGLRPDGTRPYDWASEHIQPSGPAAGCVENDMLLIHRLPVASQGAELTDENLFGSVNFGFSQRGGTLTVPELTDTRVVLQVTGGTICDWHEDHSQDNCRPNPEPVTLTLEAERLWSASPPLGVRPSTTAFDPVTGEPFCQPGPFR